MLERSATGWQEGRPLNMKEATRRRTVLALLALVSLLSAPVWLGWLGRSPEIAAEARPDPQGAAGGAANEAIDRRRPVPATERAPRAEENVVDAGAAFDDEPPIEEWEDLDLPDDVQLGPAALDLRLVDARTGAGVASHVELWRIDAPGNDHWSAGDQLQQQAHVPAEGLLFTRLPEGRYRLVCSAQVWDEEPPEVEVDAPRTQIDLALALPRSFRVRVVVRDRFEHLVPSVELGRTGSESLDAGSPWRWDRMPLNGDAILEDFEMSSVEFAPWLSLGPQTEDGFDLGSYHEAERGSHQRITLELRTPQGGRVSVRVPGRAGEDVHLVAVAVPEPEFAARVRMPGGGPAHAEVEAICEATARSAYERGGGWASAPVKIRARLVGYRPTERIWCAAQGELPWIELEPAR